MQNLAIAIVGAGPAGLAAASFLKQDGHDVTIYERFATPHPVGAGLLLQPTGLAILAALGLDRQAIAASSPIHHLYGRVAPRGRVIFDIGYGDLAPHLFGLGIHRGTLFSLLYNRVLAQQISIVTDTEIKSLSYDPRGNPVLEDAQGGSLGPFDLVIDAHGSKSGLRAQHGNIKLNKPYPYGAIWSTLCDREGLFAADTLAQRYLAARHMIGILPVGRLNGADAHSFAFFWSLRVRDYAAWQQAGIAPWQKQVIALWPETAGLLQQIETPEDLTLATYHDVILRQPYSANLAFIGDAAHCTSPQLGQGANLALIDSYTLAASLRGAGTVAGALQAYALQRKRHVWFYQTASRWLTPFFQSDSRVMPFIRDMFFNPSCRIPYMRSQMLYTLAGLKTGPFGHLNPGQWHPAYDFEPSADRQGLKI